MNCLKAAWVGICVFLSLSISSASRSRGADESFRKRTFVYKTVDQTKIEVDVYRDDDDQVRHPLVWIHGGALIVGTKNNPPKRLVELCAQQGYALVSINYRLAPEVRSPEIIKDVQDAMRWLRGRGAELCHLDTSKLVVTGGSAGGYLTLMTGWSVEPPPTALVAYWGYGDVDGDWLAKPSEFYRQDKPLYSQTEASEGVGTLLTATEPETDLQTQRAKYYHYLRQNGLWTKEVTGFEPVRQKKELDALCPIRHVTPNWPPTLLIHGTVDTDVPYEQSAAMAKELARHKVPHELVTVEGAGHGLAGGKADEKVIEAAHKRALDFIRQQME